MLDKDEIEFGLTVPKDNLGDRERMLTTALSTLDELDILITNALGYMPNKVPEPIKAKKQKGEKDDMLSGQNVGDKSTLGNRSLPRYAAKPAEPKVLSKPKNYLVKSRDFTGDVISKNERENPERRKPMPDEFEESESQDTEKFLGVVSALAGGGDDEKKALSSNEVEWLTNLKECISKLKPIIDSLEKKNRTTQVGEADALVPKDMKLVPHASSKKNLPPKQGNMNL